MTNTWWKYKNMGFLKIIRDVVTAIEARVHNISPELWNITRKREMHQPSIYKLNTALQYFLYTSVEILKMLFKRNCTRIFIFIAIFRVKKVRANVFMVNKWNTIQKLFEWYIRGKYIILETKTCQLHLVFRFNEVFYTAKPSF